MPLRPPAGFIRPGFDPLKNPNAPTAVSATAGNATASVTFTPPANVGGSAISQYQVVAYTGGTIVGNTAGTASPINVTGLTNGTAYTFAVWALNTYGPGPFSAMSGSVTPEQLQRGVFAGGSAGGNVMDYINIASTGNAIDFGDMLSDQSGYGAFSSSTRGVFAGGGGGDTTIQYITFATVGNAISFGNLSASYRNGPGSFANQTRGGIGGGFFSGSYLSRIDYVTIATTGNSTSFGNLSVARYGISSGSCSSSTRGLFCGGESSDGFTNILDFITIASTGNASDFGDLRTVTRDAATCSSSTRGLIAGNITSPGSQPSSNVIDFVTIASAGNSTDFGDLTILNSSLGATSSLLRGVFGGGFPGSLVNVIDYVTIASTGNATDFGDLTVARSSLGACSSAHGGL